MGGQGKRVRISWPARREPSKPRRDSSSRRGTVSCGACGIDLMPPRRAGPAYRLSVSGEMPRRSAAGRISSLSASFNTVRRLGWRPPFS
jgi:hypothetical protein